MLLRDANWNLQHLDCTHLDLTSINILVGLVIRLTFCSCAFFFWRHFVSSALPWHCNRGYSIARLPYKTHQLGGHRKHIRRLGLGALGCPVSCYVMQIKCWSGRHRSLRLQIYPCSATHRQTDQTLWLAGDISLGLGDHTGWVQAGQKKKSLPKRDA